MAERAGRVTAQVPPQRSRRFGFGLFLYLVLTVVVFALVWHYMPRLARQVGHIEFGWLRFSIYFTVYVLIALGSAWVVHRLPIPLRRERALQQSVGPCEACYRTGAGAGADRTLVADLDPFDDRRLAAGSRTTSGREDRRYARRPEFSPIQAALDDQGRRAGDRYRTRGARRYTNHAHWAAPAANAY